MEKTENVKKKGNLVNDIFDIIESVLFWILILRLIFIFIIGIAQVDGFSMLPTLHDEEKLIYFHLFYEPKDGDIVIINSESLDKTIVKRVIAKEGQTIDIDFETGEVTVDGQVLDEPYINNLTINNTGAFEDDEYPLTVPEGHVFVMGDNRQDSKDSRHWQVGYVSEDEIVGKVILRYSPASEFKIF